MKLEGYESDIRDRALKGYQLYWQSAHPFPFDPVEDIYRYAFNKVQWKSLNKLLDMEVMENAFRQETKFTLVVRSKMDTVSEEHAGQFPSSMKIPLSGPLPVITQVQICDIPDEIRIPLEEWIRIGYVYHRGHNRLAYLLNCIFRASGTIGHVVRLWPVLRNFLTPYCKAQVDRRKAQSPIPHDAKKWGRLPDGEWGKVGLDPDCDASRHPQLERILIGSLLLEGEPGPYPTFSDFP